MIYARVWLDHILPFIRRHPFERKYTEMAANNEKGLRNGWLLGEVNPDGRPLNQRTYDVSEMGTEAVVAIAEAFTADLRKGRNTRWCGPVHSKLPLFVGVKSRCPVTNEPTGYRVIRDGSCGTLDHPSLNSLTPDKSATITLINKRTICIYTYIMYLLYGPGGYLAKADLAGAFRQFYLAPGEPEKIIYEFDDELIADLFNVWGTRTGARICHEMTQCSAREFVLRVNGVHLLDDINHAVERADFVHFELKLQTHRRVPLLPPDVTPYTPPLRFHAHSRNTDHPITAYCSPEPDFIWRWSATAVRVWLRDVDLSEADEFLHLQNGIHLLRCHIDYVTEHHGQVAVQALERMEFFEKLVTLKLRSKQLLTVITNCYIDDYLTFLPPNASHAQHTTRRLSTHLQNSGLEESDEKREGPAHSLTMLGIQADTTDMTVQHPLRKRREATELIYKVLFHGSYTIPQHESLVGKLSHLAEYAWPGKAFINRLQSQNTILVNRHGRNPNLIITMPPWEEKDFQWWLKYIDAVSRTSILHMFDMARPTTELFFDGATNGERPSWAPHIGAWYRGSFISMPVPAHLCDQWVSDIDGTPKAMQIAQFEALAIIVGLHNMADQLGQHKKVLLRTDSMHVMAAIRNKRSPDAFLMACVRWTLMFAVRHALRLYIEYVHTKSNVYADGASRPSETSNWKARAQAECDANGWTFRQITDPTIPNFNQW